MYTGYISMHGSKLIIESKFTKIFNALHATKNLI
jgi:hypothetical protein